MEVSNKIASDIIVHTKYAKYKKKEKRRESWDEICDRAESTFLRKYPIIKKEIVENMRFIRDKKVLCSMRMMQFAGVPVERNNSRVYNCAYHAANTVDYFSHTMFLLLGGSGVGFSVQERHIKQLPSIQEPKKKKDKIASRKFLIGDSLEGWSDAIKVLMNHYLLGKYKPRFDFSDIRDKGAPLITAGGKAPGPEPLRTCISKIQGLLDSKPIGSRLESWEISDISCYIADAVYSGGIRRAAMICLFDMNDQKMLGYKSGSYWDQNPERARVNVSVVGLRKEFEGIAPTTKEEFLSFWKFVENSGTGEPGVSWSDDLDMGGNPCFSGDTRILTKSGYSRFIDSVGEVDLIGMDGKNYNGRIWKSGEKDTLILTLSSGKKIQCTPDHVFLTTEGKSLKACSLKDSHLMPFYSIKKSVSRATKAGFLQRGPKVIGIKKGKVIDVYDFTIDNKDHWGVVEGVIAHNCFEIALKDKQFCNLSTINFSSVKDQLDLESRARAASFLGTLQAGFTDFHYLGEEWINNCEEEALIGVSPTGIADGNKYTRYDWAKVALVVKETNENTALKIGVNKAARTTCIKPEGTTSLVLGTSSGVHARHSHYYIRNIRFSSNEPIALYLSEKHKELVSVDLMKPSGVVVSIPQKAPDRSVYRSESVFDLLERIKYFNKEWILPGHRSGSNTHNVSCTVSIKTDEWKSVGEWMWENKAFYNGIAVMPFDGGSYTQAPFEECTKEKYDKLMKNLKKVDLSKIVEIDDKTSFSETLACGGGKCEI